MCGDVARLWRFLNTPLPPSPSMMHSSIPFWNVRNVWWGDFIKWIPYRAVVSDGYNPSGYKVVVSQRKQNHQAGKRQGRQEKQKQSSYGNTWKNWAVTIRHLYSSPQSVIPIPLPFSQGDSRFPFPPLHTYTDSSDFGGKLVCFLVNLLFIRLPAFHLAWLMTGN